MAWAVGTTTIVTGESNNRVWDLNTGVGIADPMR